MIKEGDTVRLKDIHTSVLERGKTAKVLRIKREAVLLDRRLGHFCWWHINDLTAARRVDRKASPK